MAPRSQCIPLLHDYNGAPLIPPWRSCKPQQTQRITQSRSLEQKETKRADWQQRRQARQQRKQKHKQQRKPWQCVRQDQAQLKRLGMNQMPVIEMNNMFKEHGPCGLPRVCWWEEHDGQEDLDLLCSLSTVPEDLDLKARALEGELEEKRCELYSLRKVLEAMRARVDDVEMSRQAMEMSEAKAQEVLQKSLSVGQTMAASWSWIGDGRQKHAFDLCVSHKLEQTYQDQDGAGTCQVTSGCYTYAINFDDMIQTNVGSGKRRSIERNAVGESPEGDPLDRLLKMFDAKTQEAKQAKDECDRALAGKAQVESNMASLREMTQDNLKMKAELHAAQQKARRQDSEMAGLYLQVDNMDVEMKEQRQELLNANRTIEARGKTHQSQMKAYRDSVKASDLDLKKQQEACVEKDNDLVKTRAELTSAQAREEELKMKHTLMLKTEKYWQSIVEYWKSTSRPLECRKFTECTSFCGTVQTVFQRLSHKDQICNGMLSRCYAFQRLTVKRVIRLHNKALWKKYMERKNDMKAQRDEVGIQAKPLESRFDGFECFTQDLGLDKSCNELLLAHGCSEESVDAIIKNGFDERLSRDAGLLYGEGVYFGQQLCKTHQYAKPNGSRLHHVLICRVLLGDVMYIKNKYTGKLAPLRSANGSTGRYDAIVVDPSKSDIGQDHWEYVIFNGHQAYPELSITYELP